MFKATVFNDAEFSSTGENKIIAVCEIAIDFLEEILLTKKPAEITMLVDEGTSFVLTPQKVEEYLDFFSDAISAQNPETLPIFVNLTDDYVLDASVGYFKYMHEDEDTKKAMMDFSTILFPLNGKEKELGILQLSLSFLEQIVAKKENIGADDLIFASADLLKDYYQQFKSEKSSQKYFLLAIDMDNEKAIGYFLEPNIDEKQHDMTLVLMKQISP